MTKYTATFKNGNKNSQVFFVRSFNAYFVNTAIVNLGAERGAERKQTRFEIDEKDAAIEFASDFVK